MPSKIARTGKVNENMPEWGALRRFGDSLNAVYFFPSELTAQAFCKNFVKGHYEVVRLSGTVTYTLAK